MWTISRKHITINAMDIQKYDPKTIAVIEKLYEQKREFTEEMFETADQLLEIAQEKAEDALLGFTYFHIADALYAHEKDYSLVREDLAKAIYYLSLADEKELLTRAYNYVAIDAMNNGSYDVAYLYLMNAMQTCEELDNNYLKCIINNNLGQVFARMRSYEKAVKYVHVGNELQEMCSKDDFYYFQNLICGYFSEGILYALMGDVDGAKKMDRQISVVEQDEEFTDISAVYIPIKLLRVMLAVLDSDSYSYETVSREFIEKLCESHRIYDYITDIEDLCNFLIEHNHLDMVKEVLDIVKNTVDVTDIVLMKKIFSSIEIAYYDKLGDVDKVTECLRVQYRLSEQQQMEQNKVYQYSIDLLDIMDEQRKEQEKVRRENEELHTQVQTDPLTDIPNRLMVDTLLPKLFRQAIEDGKNFGVSLMDIDKFKEYNDTYGHLAGDICLQKVAKTIERVSGKPGVYCARYGGDEFIMLYENKSDDEIMRIAEELNNEIKELNIAHSAMGENGRVSVSQGICNAVPMDGDIQEEFLNEADNALYAIKKRLELPGKSESVRLVHLK